MCMLPSLHFPFHTERGRERECRRRRFAVSVLFPIYIGFLFIRFFGSSAKLKLCKLCFNGLLVHNFHTLFIISFEIIHLLHNTDPPSPRHSLLRTKQLNRKRKKSKWRKLQAKTCGLSAGALEPSIDCSRRSITFP